MDARTEFESCRVLMDRAEIGRVVRRMAVQLVELEPRLERMLLVGIRTRGLPLAERLADEIEAIEGLRPPIGALDITLYRDDLSTIGPQPVVGETSFPVPLDDRVVVLADDVLYTGRTVRAALDELSDWGRPSVVRLAVLVDRGRRELPIQADVVGRLMQTSAEELVEVALEATDGCDEVRLLRPLAGGARQ